MVVVSDEFKLMALVQWGGSMKPVPRRRRGVRNKRNNTQAGSENVWGSPDRSLRFQTINASSGLSPVLRRVHLPAIGSPENRFK